MKNVAGARRAVEAYGSDRGDDGTATLVGDLICDLLHLLAEPDVLLEGADLPIPLPPPEFDSGRGKPGAASTAPYVVLARGLNHYLAEIAPESIVSGDAEMDPLDEDVEEALDTIGAFLRG